MLETINGCITCTNTFKANSLINKLKGILEFDNVVYGLAKLNGTGLIVSYDIINFSYPSEWLDLYKERKFHTVDPISIENFCSFNLQFWEDTYKKRRSTKEFIFASMDFSLINGYACGVKNQKGTEGSILSFAGKLTKKPRNKYIIEIVTPHLHQAFSSILSSNKKQSSITLSKREVEILKWIKRGKSSWAISMIFSISESTVKFHVNNIMMKLDAVSRTHAVAIALSEGVIDID